MTESGIPGFGGSARVHRWRPSDLFPARSISSIWQAPPIVCARKALRLYFLSVDGQAAGVIAVAGPIKATTKAALDRLHAEGLRIVMLTGGPADTAAVVARALGIYEVEAQVLPEDKYRIVEKLKTEGSAARQSG